MKMRQHRKQFCWTWRIFDWGVGRINHRHKSRSRSGMTAFLFTAIQSAGAHGATEV
jgi:hypothetical protein